MLTWTKEYRNLQATGGTRACFALPFPARCRINRVVIIQTGGTLSEFKAKLFNSKRPCTGASASSGGADPLGTYEAEPDAYLVIPDSVMHGGVSGEAFVLTSNDGYVFENVDGGNVCLREYLAYLEINSLGPSELMTFDVAFTCDMGGAGR